jgi:hypothetical protein
MSEKKPQAQPMKEPMKPHGDKIDPHDGKRESGKDRRSGDRNEPPVTPFEPEKQGGIGGP